MSKWCPDLMKPRYTIWAKFQIPLVAVSLCFGYFLFGWAGFFWLGAIRMLYCLHGQCFVNSLLHLKPGLSEGVDSSQNIWWLGPFQVTAWGENWHGNHHSQPWSARLGLRPLQVDAGWWAIVAMEKVRLARDVRRPRDLVPAVAAVAVAPVASYSTEAD
jgi:stearoyl-CoA desaturase (delta-9 desaturase)